MGDKLFRSDLYYRLKVFPIMTPPLRDHPEDIPVLARHFTKKYAAKMDRTIDKIPSETMRALVSWSWPGNVRELENFIERSVILSRGPNLRAPLAELRADAAETCRRFHARRSGAGSYPARVPGDRRRDQRRGDSSRDAADDLERHDEEAGHLPQRSLGIGLVMRPWVSLLPRDGQVHEHAPRPLPGWWTDDRAGFARNGPWLC